MSSAIAITITTLLLVFWRPKGLGIGLPTLAGAGIAFFLGLVNLADVTVAWETFGDSLIVILSLLIIARTLEAVGFFRQLVPFILYAGLGRGRWLFLLCALLSALLSALFTNYGSILLFTPALVAALRELRLHRQQILAYVFVTGFMANAASLPLLSSHPLNSVTLDLFRLSPWRYWLVLIPTHVVIFLTTLIILWFYFDLSLPLTYSWQRQKDEPVRSPLLCSWGFPILGVVFVGLFFTTPSFILVSLAALLTLILTFAHSPQSGLRILYRLPWQVILFSLGIYFIGIALGKAGLIPLLSQGLSELSNWGISLAITGIGFLVTLLSFFLQNTSGFTNTALALQNASLADAATEEAMIFSTLIGAVIGAKISPIGSFATLLWLDIIRRKVLPLSWREYVRIHLALTLPILFIAFLFLAVWLPWLTA